MKDVKDDPDDEVAVPFEKEVKEEDEAVETSLTASTPALCRAGFNSDLR